MKRLNRLQLSAILIFGAFILSFFLPSDRWQFGGIWHTDSGWRCAADMVPRHWSDLKTVALPSTAANLIIPLVLVILAVPRFAIRLPHFTPWLIVLFAVNASYFFWSFAIHRDDNEALSFGYYVWWPCQIATAALAFWNRRAESKFIVGFPAAPPPPRVSP
jgi:hypothetical protein